MLQQTKYGQPKEKNDIFFLLTSIATLLLTFLFAFGSVKYSWDFIGANFSLVPEDDRIVLMGISQILAVALSIISAGSCSIHLLKRTLRQMSAFHEQRISEMSNLPSRIDSYYQERKTVDAIFLGEDEDIFNEMRNTSTMKGVQGAINHCWQVHEWGRLPAFKALSFSINISNEQSEVSKNIVRTPQEKPDLTIVLDPDAPDTKEDTAGRGRNFEAQLPKSHSVFDQWRWLRIDFEMSHGVDTDVRTSTGSAHGEKDFFVVSRQTFLTS